MNLDRLRKKYGCGAFNSIKCDFQDWTKKGGWRVLKSKPLVLPGQEGFPYKSDRTQPSDYAERGFKKATI